MLILPWQIRRLLAKSGEWHRFLPFFPSLFLSLYIRTEADEENSATRHRNWKRKLQRTASRCWILMALPRFGLIVWRIGRRLFRMRSLLRRLLVSLCVLCSGLFAGKCWSKWEADEAVFIQAPISIMFGYENLVIGKETGIETQIKGVNVQD